MKKLTNELLFWFGLLLFVILLGTVGHTEYQSQQLMAQPAQVMQTFSPSQLHP